MAQQQRALAQSSDELQQAAQALRAASDRKILEQQIAQKNFELERQRVFDALREYQTRLASSALWGPRRLEAENRLESLITLFNLKDFDAVRRELPDIHDLMERAKTRYHRPTMVPTRSRPGSTSASALFEQGRACEREGRVRDAIEAYGKVLDLNPRHFQAVNRLKRINQQVADPPHWR